MSAAEQAYAREQAKLRQQEGMGASDDGDGDDLHIDVPQFPEVNPEVFRDVEPLLFKGFVYVPAVINDVTFVFKSLNHHEFELLNLMRGDFGKNVSHKALQKQFNLFLAFGVLIVDGINILPERDKHLVQVADMFGNLNEVVRKKVISSLSEINRRANRAVVLTEAYAMENQSRLRWAQYKGSDMTSASITGFAGTPNLGLNWGQLVWRAANYFEDLKENVEREWENAKFIASAMAGKGMQRVHSQDRQRRKREREERLERRDKILRFALLNEAPSEAGSGVSHVKVARTVEELAAQLEHDLKGEKDWHDMVVDQYERRVKNEHQARLEAIRQRQVDYQDRYGDQSVIGGSDPKEGLTPDEVRFRIERRRQLTAQRLAAQAAVPELHDPKMSQFLDKWATRQDSDPSQVAPLQLADRPRAIPVPPKRGNQ